MQCRSSFDSPSPSSQPNHGHSPFNRINLDVDTRNLFGTQIYLCRSMFRRPSYPVEDDSLVEEVAPVKAKKVSKRRQKAKTTENHEASKPWITMEEVALYKVWIDMSENNIRGNAMKTMGFRFAVLDYFEKDLREHYDHDFTLEPGWRILKDRVAWKHVEMLSFYKQQNKGCKKAKTFETTLDLAHGALNLNEEANGFGEEVQEI
nr:hypothetical protein [Tanacetum cinerariifolium]